MKRLIFLLALLPALAWGQAEQPIYKATPSDHACIDGRFCSPLVDSNGRFIISAAGTPLAVTILTPVPVFTPSAHWPVDVSGTPIVLQRAEATIAAIVTILPTAFPTAFSTPQFANATALRSAFISNSTNQEIWCATAGLTTPNIVIPAGGYWFDNYAATGSQMSGAIGCIHPANTPASGSVEIGGRS